MRNTKTVKLSEDGKTLYQYARQMIELEQEIQSMFSKAAEQKERCITIATSTIPAQYILPDILEAIADNPLKFILFIDDLSFSEDDETMLH